MSTQIKPILTVADLDLMPDDGNRYELIEGEIFVSRAPSLTHQLISGNFFAFLRGYLEQHPIGKVIATPGVIFDDLNSSIPDIVYLSRDRVNEIASGERIMGAPDLVIEIMSPGAENARRDRLVKRQVYSKHGVKEYWIADPENRAIEVYRPQNQTLELVVTLMNEDELTTPLLPNFRCQVSNIFQR